jgi:general secretion pathway protein G
MIGSTPHRSRGAFTLIEVLLVLVILVTLASLAVTTYDGIRNKANINAARVQIELFKDQLELFKLSVQRYPYTDEGLLALIECPADVDPYNWPGPLVDNIPFDPWGQEYQYMFPGQVGGDYRFDLWSMGPDKSDNTEDDICSWVSEM